MPNKDVSDCQRIEHCQYHAPPRESRTQGKTWDAEHSGGSRRKRCHCAVNPEKVVTTHGRYRGRLRDTTAGPLEPVLHTFIEIFDVALPLTTMSLRDLCVASPDAIFGGEC
jgi:hypothetical protein